MNFHLKYRPATFKEIVGNRDMIKTIKAVVASGDVPHALLFFGPTGCGKTTLGRIVAHELGAMGNDLREVDSADFRGIDTIRDIRKQSQFQPLEGPVRVWILDECHKLSNDAQNALLKALEDTPTHVYYILCTTDPQKLLPAIRSRCSSYQVKPLVSTEMRKLLEKVVTLEGDSLDDEVYELIIANSQGLPRSALQTLAQVLITEPGKRLAVATKSAEVDAQVIELCRALVSNAPWKKTAIILKSLKEQEQDPEGIRRAVLGYCQALLLNGKADPAAADTMQAFIDPFYDSLFPGLTLACFTATFSNKE